MKKITMMAMAAIGFAAVMSASSGYTATIDGAAVYAGECEVCHGVLKSSTKMNRTAAQIQSAINGNIGGMGYLTYMTAAEVQATAAALANGAPAPVTGPALYGSYCAGCHGSLANSTKKNRTAAQTQAAINANAGGMGALKTLTAAQVQMIAAALASGTAPAPGPAPAPAPAPSPAPGVDGAALYGTGCAACHSALATSTKKNRTAAQITSAITGNVGGMGYLNTLTAAQVSAIATALSTATTPAPAPVTGPAAPVNLSATAAAGAAGAAQQVSGTWTDANGVSNIKLVFMQVGTAATGGVVKVKYDVAMKKLFMMNDAGAAWAGGFAPGSVNTITNKLMTLDCAKTKVTTSGNDMTVSFNLKPAAGYTGGKPLYLFAYDMGMLAPKAWDMKGTWTVGAVGTTPAPAPVPGIDGAALYASGCAGCHGPLATSAKKNRTTAQIQNAITGNAGGMGTASLMALSAAQVQAIAAALAGSTPPSTTPPPVITDGGTLYGMNCAACHGALASSGVKGSNVTSIQGAITKNKGGMGYLSILTPAQVAAIAGVL